MRALNLRSWRALLDANICSCCSCSSSSSLGIILGVVLGNLRIRAILEASGAQRTTPAPLRTRARRGRRHFRAPSHTFGGDYPGASSILVAFCFFRYTKERRTNERTDGRIRSKRRPTNRRMASFAEFRPFGRLFVDWLIVVGRPSFVVVVVLRP